MIAAILRIIAADSIDMYVLDASFFVQPLIDICCQFLSNI